MHLRDNLFTKALFYIHPLIIPILFTMEYRLTWSYLVERNYVKGEVSWGVYIEIQFYIIVTFTILLLLLLYFFTEKIKKIYVIYTIINLLVIGFFLHYSINRFICIAGLFLVSTTISFMVGCFLMKKRI